MLVNVLSEDVAFDITCEVKSLSVNVGQMGSHEHALRKKKLKSTQSKNLYGHLWLASCLVQNTLAVPLLSAVLTFIM